MLPLLIHFCRFFIYHILCIPGLYATRESCERISLGLPRHRSTSADIFRQTGDTHYVHTGEQWLHRTHLCDQQW